MFISQGSHRAAAVPGLCHDLGHGPFSHVFEKELLPKLFPGNPNIVNEW